MVGSSAALTVQNVSFSYDDTSRGSVRVLDGISFEVRDGEFLTVMGPSGCGKTTILNVLAGFLRPTSGWVGRYDKPIERPGADRGVVFQKPALYPWMTVLENVLFGPRATGKMSGAAERARTLLEEMGLSGFEQCRPYELSGGMQHRVALARTLANNPEVLLMDEPFAALDAQTRAEMQALLLEVWQHYRPTMVFITHDIEEGLLLADRVVILSHRPSTVRAVLDVTIPRPRTYDTVLDAAFVEMRGRVRTLLRRETTT